MSYFITIHTVITPAHMGRLQQIPLNEFKKVLKKQERLGDAYPQQRLAAVIRPLT